MVGVAEILVRRSKLDSPFLPPFEDPARPLFYSQLPNIKTILLIKLKYIYIYISTKDKISMDAEERTKIKDYLVFLKESLPILPLEQLVRVATTRG